MRKTGGPSGLLQCAAMSAGTKNCGQCEHANSIDAMFCSKCGSRLPSREDVERAREAAPEVMATPRAPRRARPIAKTMVGWDGTGGDDPAPPASAQLAAERAAAPAPDAPAPDAPAEHAPAEHAPAEHAPAQRATPNPARRIPASARTMLGMPAPDARAIAEAVERAKAPAAANPAESASDPSARTMPDDPAHLGTLPGEASAPKGPALGPTHRTMLGLPAPKVDLPPADGPETAPRGRAPVVYPDGGFGEGRADGDDEPVLPRKRSGKLAVAMIALGLVVLVGAGVALLMNVFSSADLEAAVVQGEDGEMLDIAVPGATSGTKVRFNGAELPLEAGHARFPLSADDLALGDNRLTVDVIAPDGDVESRTIALRLEMRVRADLGALAQVPPAIDVVVEAPPGSEASLDGEPLTLDDRGRGKRRIAIEGADASAEGVVEHIVRYRVVPPEGEAAQGELRTRIPLSTMQLDRPGAQVVTEKDSVEVAGAVAPGSTVTVAGEEVEVNLGRFLTTHPLPELGEHTIEVVARAPSKAPRVERIQVRRVADLAAEAEGFEVNASLTYARIIQNPTTYRGQKVELIGDVYNVDVSNGRSVLQMLVEPCPDERCPLWVTYPAATDTQLRDRVRVLGTVAGEQQFRSQRGEIRTVPRVDATFLLPARAGR